MGEFRGLRVGWAGGAALMGCELCVYYCSTYYKAVRVGGGG